MSSGLADTLRPLPPGTAVLVGFSGGLDSTVLLHALSAERGANSAGLRAIHVDHGLHSQSARWAEHCHQVCSSFGVELQVVQVDVERGDGGPEAAARSARHAAFARALQPGEWLALAQHRDDQAETVLLRLLRASGSAGLGAMRARRPFSGATLWRPLLALPRSALVDYARDHGLRWIEDPSNSDTAFDRNFLRHQLLPLLRQRWPAADAALTRSASLLAEDAELLDQECAKHLANARGPEPATLSIAGLTALAPAWQSRLLRAWLAKLGLPPISASGVAAVLGPLLAARADAVPEYAWPGGVLRRWRGLLWAEPELAVLPPDWQVDWDGVEPVRLPNGDCFELLSPQPINPLQLRLALRRGGERIRLPGRGQRSELKTVLQTLAVPPWQRARLPLLFDADGELLAVGELLRSQRMVERGWQFRRLPCLPADQLAN